MDKTCYYCGSLLVKNNKCQENYVQCSGCNTFFSLIEPDYEYNGGELREFYKKKIQDMHRKDYAHYMRLKETEEFKSISSYPFGTIFAFGGGVPKLESCLTFDNIISYDLNADLYLEVMDEFGALYNIEKQRIEMRSDFVNSKLIRGMDYGPNGLITFVHFLEHLSPVDFVSIMDSIPVGVNVLIYQPEASRAKGPGWFHFNDRQHLVIMELAHMIKFFQDWYNIEIVTKRYNSDDLLLVFRKRINR